jgi:hypothetical protein
MPGITSSALKPAHHPLDAAADPAVRATAAIGLFGVGIVHALEIQGQLSGAAWLTAGFCALAVAAPAAGLWLLARPSALAWQAAGLLCAMAAGGYILTRSVPVPGDPGDVGNWLEPLGVAALIIEGTVVVLAALVLASLARGPVHATQVPASPAHAHAGDVPGAQRG